MSLSKIVKGFCKFVDDEFGDKADYVSDQISLPECPFCGERRSRKVYFGLENKFGDCKVCGVTFNAPQFVAKYLDIPLKEAYDKLLFGVSEDNLVLKPMSDVKEEKVEERPNIVIPYGELALDNEYLTQTRGISNELIRKHKLIKCETGRFGGRIIIPIFDVDNNIVTYQGRDYTGELEPKYLFPKNFNVKTTLFNINHIKPNSLYVILSEGVFDCLGWEKAGVNVVGSFGKSISIDQILLLHKLGIKDLYIAWDLDAIPQIIKLYTNYSHYFHNVYYIYMEHDADEVDAVTLRQWFLNACPYNWEELIRLHLKNLP